MCLPLALLSADIESVAQLYRCPTGRLASDQKVGSRQSKQASDQDKQQANDKEEGKKLHEASYKLARNCREHCL